MSDVLYFLPFEGLLFLHSPLLLLPHILDLPFPPFALIEFIVVTGVRSLVWFARLPAAWTLRSLVESLSGQK